MRTDSNPANTAISLTVVAVIFLSISLKIFAPYLTPVVVAATMGILTWGAFTRLRDLLARSRWLKPYSPAAAAFIIWLLTTSVVILPGFFLGNYALVSGIGTIREFIGDFLLEHESINAFLQTQISNLVSMLPEEVVPTVQERLGEFATVGALFSGKMGGAAFGFISSASVSVLGAVGTLAFSLLLFFFVHTDGPAFLKWMNEKLYLRERGDDMFTEVAGLIKGIVLGSVLVQFIQASAYSLTLFGISLFVDIPNLGVWIAVIMIAGTIIPVVATAGMAIAVGMLFYSGAFIPGIVGVVVIAIFSTVDGIIRGWFVGSQVKIPVSLIVFSTIFGLGLFGFVGLILGPAVVALGKSAAGHATEAFAEWRQFNAEREAEKMQIKVEQLDETRKLRETMERLLEAQKQ
ncbi:MAG: AI-2E family transporter [Candidatus Kaiserbacteria bacterium]|nr:AI-2E family transporter [Candidatus Kaiserbacteria bacterium]MCB9816704.1 AI-2E family transporter [Candidatus Nomurabacteria bacterium]